MRKISQREARRLQKRVKALEEAQRVRIRRWGTAYPGGVNFATCTLDAELAARVQTAQSLGFTVVGRIDGNRFLLYGVQP